MTEDNVTEETQVDTERNYGEPASGVSIKTLHMALAKWMSTQNATYETAALACLGFTASLIQAIDPLCKPVDDEPVPVDLGSLFAVITNVVRGQATSFAAALHYARTGSFDDQTFHVGPEHDRTQSAAGTPAADVDQQSAGLET
jgi:hypothetical protein